MIRNFVKLLFLFELFYISYCEIPKEYQIDKSSWLNPSDQHHMVPTVKENQKEEVIIIEDESYTEEFNNETSNKCDEKNLTFILIFIFVITIISVEFISWKSKCPSGFPKDIPCSSLHIANDVLPPPPPAHFPQPISSNNEAVDEEEEKNSFNNISFNDESYINLFGPIETEDESIQGYLLTEDEEIPTSLEPSSIKDFFENSINTAEKNSNKLPETTKTKVLKRRISQTTDSEANMSNDEDFSVISETEDE